MKQPFVARYAGVCCLLSLLAACGTDPEMMAEAGSGGVAGSPIAGTGGGDPMQGGTGGMSTGGQSGAAGTMTGGSGGTAGATEQPVDAGADLDAALTPDAGGDAGPPCENGKVVHFVYFVEADETYSEAQRDDVEEQAYRFQQYWYDQLGVTFYLNDPIVDVIEGDHEADWYLTTPDGIHGDSRWYRLGNMKNEVYSKLGIDNFDDNHRVVNYPTTRHDGRVGGNFGGAWMDGDDLTCIGSGGFNYPYDDNNSAHCTGHVAHEFGHVLGLDHQGPNSDCMQFGFYTDDADDLCSFSADNVAQILAEPDNDGWFEAQPGESCTGL